MSDNKEIVFSIKTCDLDLLEIKREEIINSFCIFLDSAKTNDINRLFKDNRINIGLMEISDSIVIDSYKCSNSKNKLDVILF